MIVDVDDPQTWPPDVRREAQAIADSVRGKAKYVSDLPIPIEGEDPFRALLAGHPLVAYHATRLLDHEVAMIREQGLRPLTAKLVEDRIEAAYGHSLISD